MGVRDRKILVCGLPGAGKTTLSQALAPRLSAVHFNADGLRENVNKDLGFSGEDRIEQAKRMGWLCDQVVKAGGIAIADFVCPTEQTRATFGAGGAYTMVFVDRIQQGRFADTNRIWERPDASSATPIFYVESNGSPEFWAEKIANVLLPVFDPEKPTALFVGRYQPFHGGHKALVVHGIQKVGQALIAVRNTPRDAKNPFGFDYVRAAIERGLTDYRGRFSVIQIPNVAAVMYGRDVGYKVEEVFLDESITSISATETRRRMGDSG